MSVSGLTHQSELANADYSMLQFLIFEGEQEMAGWHKSRLLLQLRIQALRDSIIATAAGWR
ncbi:hypothetical protein EZMO1_4062 [Endozoicomonas montiporae CL-33]|uniref:Uncharacterized protein n=1 Tax=Endozoicomonas montiporae CL-33 TaxID=570277 RepID=A0A142BGW4_9GAMM|nr:hypothetical protein EZMO1_4062 [Endozoicomonas montiporae CL-33]